MDEIKTSLAQEATKLETAIEAELGDSVGKEEVFCCVRELREEVVGIRLVMRQIRLLKRR